MQSNLTRSSISLCKMIYRVSIHGDISRFWTILSSFISVCYYCFSSKIRVWYQINVFKSWKYFFASVLSQIWWLSGHRKFIKVTIKHDGMGANTEVFKYLHFISQFENYHIFTTYLTQNSPLQKLNQEWFTYHPKSALLPESMQSPQK